MNILITGGTGFVGSNLTARLLELGHNVTVTSSSGNNRFAEYSSLHLLTVDTSKGGDWQNKLSEYDVIVNLAGRSVFHLWTESYKRQIYSSRIDTTKNIVDGMPDKSDTVLLNASAAGYYGDGGENEFSENSPSGSDFLAEVCRSWEGEAIKAEGKGARVALMRFGVVLGPGGGAISTMKTPFLLGMGGPIGSGNQWFPWIHLEDVVNAIVFLIGRSDVSGAFNFTAPGMVRQKDFARTLGKTLKRPAVIPVPAFAMKAILGEFGKSLLQGQKVVPAALLKNDFSFSYPSLDGALKEILRG